MLLSLPALLVCYVLVETLVSEPSPARQGSYEPCSPEPGVIDRAVGVRHPGRVRFWFDEYELCKVRYQGAWIEVCGHSERLTSSWMGDGCVFARPHGYVAQGRAGLYYEFDHMLRRLDPIPWPERLVIRAADQPLAGLALLLIVLGVPWIWARRSTRHRWVVVYGLFAGSTCWLVFSFASAL